MTSEFLTRRAAVFAACASAALRAACSSMPGTGPEGRSYLDPYQSYKSLCVVPAEDHSATYDLTLMRMLRDRGFEPDLMERGDRESVRRCRGIVTFSTGKTPRPFDAPAFMSLTFLDTYTGETYHVYAARSKAGEGHALFADAPFSDPGRMIKNLVERLFPERIDH